MSIPDVATYFVVQIQSDQDIKKQREEVLKLVIEFLKRTDKSNKTLLMNLLNSAEAIEVLSKNIQELNKTKENSKDYYSEETILKIIGPALAGPGLQLFFTDLAKKYGLSVALGPVGTIAGALGSLIVLISKLSDRIDLSSMRKDFQGAPRDIMTLEALSLFKGSGDKDAELLWDEYIKRMNREPGVTVEDPLYVEKRTYDPRTIQKMWDDPDLGPKLKLYQEAYNWLLLLGEAQTKIMDHKEVLDQTAKTINSTEILGEKVGELGQECDSSTKSLSSFSKFLAEGKLGDLAHLDTSKQNAVFEAPSAELEDYEIDYPEKAPEAVKKVPFFSGYSYALPDEYNKQYTSKQNEMSEAPSAELDKYEIDYPEKAPGSGFFGGLKESFMSETKKLLDSFGIGGGKGLLGNLFGGKGTGGGLFGMLGAFAVPQEGILGTIQQFASMIPGIGGMISNIIGGLSEEEKVAKDVTRDLGVSISEDLAKKIADTSKDIGDRFTAVIVGPVV
jgi:hypothetical protein